MTPDGLEKLKKELNELKTVKRQEIADRLEKAIAYGDLAENSEYHETKEAQGFLEGRILELEEILNSAETITSGTRKRNLCRSDRRCS